jgi:hypothetical protein
METTKNASVHRFHDMIALRVGNSATEYLTPEMARKLAVSLARFADDVEHRKFTAPGGLGTDYHETETA